MKNNKEIFKNLLSFGSIDVLGLLIPIITMPILTRALQPALYGELMLFFMVMIFGHTIIDYGTQFTAVRVLSKARKKKKTINFLYTKYQGLRLFLAGVYFSLASLYCLVFELGNLANYIYTFGFVYLLGYALTPIWFFQGMGDTVPLLKVSLAIKAIHLLVIISFVKTSEDIIYPVLSMTVPLLAGGVLLALFAQRKYGVGWPIFNYVAYDIKNGKDVFIGLLAPNLYNSLPTIILGTIFPLAQFAQYAIASKLISVIFTVQNVISKSIYSTVAMSKVSQVKKLLTLNFVISIIPILGVFLFGKTIITALLGAAYEDASKYFVVLSIGALFLGLSNAISIGYFLPNGFDKIYRNISIRVSLISALVAIIAIHFFGLMGGAVSLTFARALFLLDYSICYIALKREDNKF
ncbi:lipopolysaccharide biosynthesis protein [Pseudoalteromonas sp. SG45-1]|uniref:lipopolysaccharide biosynthesis protein n=1 Tax=Pseudoalteromonas sp. SG45-1 TaxID=2760957 RepID=UPI001602130E|nr:oligosaccharide flippase family protein [Pseudoalteromonas sp. SG45-1]MBB1400968.1 oligosaccharide flippase family protein [Pseudoalteromonas sp. SG45-1]